MSSNISIVRICQYCGKEFMARTTVTRCCSDKCSKRFYKAKKRAEKIEASNLETAIILNTPIEELKHKAFLTVPETSKLLGVSVRTLYRLMSNGGLKYGQVGRRTIIRKIDLDSLFNTNKH